MVSECMISVGKCQLVKSLNPCCYGRWSQSPLKASQSSRTKTVLILVVMEDGLRDEEYVEGEANYICLNPCCYGRWSQSYEVLCNARG